MKMFRYVSMIVKQFDAKLLNGKNQKAFKMTSSRNLSQLTANRVDDFLNSFDVVLSDCDGVLWHMDKPIPGAVDTLRKLEDLGKRIYLVTNNGTISIDRYRGRLKQFGMDVKPEQIITTAKTVAWYLKKINFRDEAFVIASTVFRQVLVDNGINLAPESLTIDENNASMIVKAIEDVSSVKAVVVDFCLYSDWVKMAFAVSCLKNDDVLYLTGAQDEWVVCGHNRRVLGPGPLINIVTKQSGRTPIECAKPSNVLKDYVLENCRVENPRRCLFIGDTINYDMKFGTMCGFLKLFVQSGLDKVEEAEMNERTRPDFYISNLGVLNPLLDSISNVSMNRPDAYQRYNLRQ